MATSPPPIWDSKTQKEGASFSSIFGQSDTMASSDFWQSILSGNPAVIAKALGPQISTIEGQKQQGLDTLSQFGNRSGGTNAAEQTASTTAASNIDDLIGELTGAAATNLGSTGLGLLGNETSNQGPNKILGDITSTLSAV